MQVDFLTGCHSTPYYTHVHRDIDMWFPDCSPEGRASAEGSESARFERDPAAFVSAMYAAAAGAGADATGLTGVPRRAVPSHVVLFDSTEPALRQLLARLGFARVRAFFHSHVNGDADGELPQRRMLVYRQHDARRAFSD